MDGTVKWFNVKKGYGFISGSDGNDYFVHYTELPQGSRVRDEDKVTFDPAEGEKGKAAKNVKLEK